MTQATNNLFEQTGRRNGYWLVRGSEQRTVLVDPEISTKGNVHCVSRIQEWSDHCYAYYDGNNSRYTSKQNLKTTKFNSREGAFQAIVDSEKIKPDTESKIYLIPGIYAYAYKQGDWYSTSCKYLHMSVTDIDHINLTNVLNFLQNLITSGKTLKYFDKRHEEPISIKSIELDENQFKLKFEQKGTENLSLPELLHRVIVTEAKT